jgi:streptogramin lyase
MRKNLIVGAMLAFTFTLGGLAVNQADAQDKVKYCKNAQTGEITTVAGMNNPGYSGDGGLATRANIDVPLDIATDAQGNVYLSDWHHHVVRKLDIRTGRIDTIAGTGARTYNGEGQARLAALAVPLGLSVDQQGNLYIADYGNNRIRKIDASSGRISTVAGSGVSGYSGDGGPAVLARLNRPYNVFVDGEGDLFISDAGNHRVRHVDARSGIITTIAGQGEYGHSDDHRLALDEPAYMNANSARPRVRQYLPARQRDQANCYLPACHQSSRRSPRSSCCEKIQERLR